MKKLLYLACLCSMVICLSSCEREGEKENGENFGSIYGCVTDFATGNPVHNANVQLRPTGETTLTGSDGMYEFLDIEDGNYSITVSKAEYSDLIDDYVIKVKNGRRMRRDVQIEKIPTYIRLTDMMGNDITELNFGTDASTNVLSFNVYNNGTVSVKCEIICSCNWIISISDIPNALKPGQNVMVSVQIDRSKLIAGKNSTSLYVMTNNGSNVLNVIAIGAEIRPNVITLPATYQDGTINAWCNTFHAEVTEVGNPAYHKRGFCYSSTNNDPTIKDNRIDVSGTGKGEYHYTCHDFDWETKKVTFYVKAWLMYGSDNKIIYGNVQSFVYNDVY